jgi:uncharacterized membrane protein
MLNNKLLAEKNSLKFVLPFVMGIVRLFFLLLGAASLIFLVIGLFRPWAMLWWEDVQNRRKVIKVYGIVAILCYFVYWGLYFFT